MNIKLLLSALLFISHFSLLAQNVFLDSNFAGPAKGHKIFNDLEGVASAVAVDAQGRIFMAINGSSQRSVTANDTIFVIRLTPNGMKDYPFGGTDTIATITDTVATDANCLILQPDGKILIGGSTRHNIDYGRRMMLIRLKPDGSRDETFGERRNGVWLEDDKPNYYNNEVTDIALQGKGNIIVAGNVDQFMSVLCLTTSGRIDPLFNQYIPPLDLWGYTTGLVLHNDTIIASGNYSDVNGGYQTSVVKLWPDGKPYVNSSTVWNNGRVDIYAGSQMPDQTKGGLAVQKDGDIFVGAQNDLGFTLSRILANGGDYASNTINIYGYPKLSKILIDANEKIVMSGYRGDAYIVCRLDEKWGLDSTFGNYGQMFINLNPDYIPTCFDVAFSRDKNLLMVGEEVGPHILKVNFTPVVHIVGSNYVQPNSGEVYTFKVPYGWSTDYTCRYSDPSVVFLSSTVGDSIELYFRESSTNTGTLFCKTNKDRIVVEKKITINRNPTLAQELDMPKCPIMTNNCSSGFIDYFKLNLLRNDSSGCSSNGYTDYTRSSMVDTLIVGGVYSATFRVNDSGVYVGIWIDYNNDGIFNTSDEFVAEQYSANSGYIQIQNIILKNEAGYFGPKRMRVRSRSNGGAFTSGESCQSAEDLGETEDYLVVLVKQDKLAGPQIITPNEDGKNDYFVVRGVKPDSKNKLTVFDRWGKVQFSAENYENNWNGISSKGDKLLPGTYYYLFSHNDESIRGFLEIRY